MPVTLILAAALLPLCFLPLAALNSPKEWTVMVYVNGKNDLETFALDDLNEMERAGTSDKVNVVAELGRMNGYSQEEGDWKGVRRYLVTADSLPYEITSPVLQDLGQRDMGDWRELEEFGRWAMANYPARHYMLIVWNHGSGWRAPGAAAGRGISYDYATGNHITTPQLARALGGIGRVHVYASDACLMQMAEVAYELKDKADYIVGSEETEPVAGYPYDTLLGGLLARPDMSPAELAKLTVNSYADYYAKKKTASTCSVLKASSLAALREKTDAFARSLMLCGDKEAFRAARGAALSYAFEDNTDLYDLAELTAGFSADAGVKAKAADLLAFLSGELVTHNRYTLAREDNEPYNPWKGPVPQPRGYDKSRGLAVYAPTGDYNGAYGDLAWARDSIWPRFVTWYLGAGAPGIGGLSLEYN